MRSPELMSTADTGLLVIDVQQKLVPLIAEHERIIWNVRRLIDGARLFNLPIVATEQYPQGLGETTAGLRPQLGTIVAKTSFSGLGCGAVREAIERLPAAKWLVCGIESHVCVQQTVLDLLALGFRAYVAVDAIGARQSVDHELALRRMDASGATLTTTEAALFEWCQDSAAPQFKDISRLIKESPPR